MDHVESDVCIQSSFPEVLKYFYKRIPRERLELKQTFFTLTSTFNSLLDRK